jgi:hypothetical protein
MTTPAQAAVRAENGRKYSTGPKTPEGKKTSSANALKHGGYAKRIPVIPNGPLAENPEAYTLFREGVIASLNTVGPVEEELAGTIANLMWRSRRTPVIEALYLAADPALWPLPGSAEPAWPTAWMEIAARVLRDPEDDHQALDLHYAALGAGHTVGFDMDDDWPQPRPSTREEWNQLTEETLAMGDCTREDAATWCDQHAAHWRAERDSVNARLSAAEVKRIVDSDLMAKLVRVEAYLGRELSRQLGLLRQLQADRRAQESDG